VLAPDGGDARKREGDAVHTRLNIDHSLRSSFVGDCGPHFSISPRLALSAVTSGCTPPVASWAAPAIGPRVPPCAAPGHGVSTRQPNTRPTAATAGRHDLMLVLRHVASRARLGARVLITNPIGVGEYRNAVKRGEIPDFQ
jgi:hypothetical protein